MRYHFSTRTRQEEFCQAQPDSCQYGDHFDDIESAKSFTQVKNEEEFGKFAKVSSVNGKAHTVRGSIIALNKIKNFHSWGTNDRFQEEINLLKSLVKQESSDSLHTRVLREDSDFRSKNETLNDVRRVILENGTVGYFKPIREEGSPLFTISPVREISNEIAAYKLSQMLGEGFDELVPETTIRLYDGQVGSIQSECIESETVSVARKVVSDSSHMTHCFVFDHILENQDRHDGNIMIQNPPPRYRMIDNGLSLPESDKHTSPNEVTTIVAGRRYVPTEREKKDVIKKVQKFLDTYSEKDLEQFMSKKSAANAMERARGVIISFRKKNDVWDDDWN